MKVSEQKVYIECVSINETKAGESSDVDNILTSPDLFQTVGLPAWR